MIKTPDGLDARTSTIVRDVALAHFGERPRHVRQRAGGLTNTVVEFKAAGGRYIMRLHHQSAQVHQYLKECWAVEAARAAGVPTPKILEVATLPDGRPYMIAEHVDGIDARRCPNRLLPLAEMGRLAARLHGIRTHGYGTVFDWSGNLLSRHDRWPAYVDHGLDAEARIQTLQRHRMLDDAQVRELRALVAAMRRWRALPVLQHGDLRLKNLILDPDTWRVRAVIDWETCVSLPPPHFELSIALHELGIDEKEAFLDGYGMTARHWRAAAPFVRLWNVLDYAGAVATAALARDRKRLDWFRLRLAAALDLYLHQAPARARALPETAA